MPLTTHSTAKTRLVSTLLLLLTSAVAAQDYQPPPPSIDKTGIEEILIVGKRDARVGAGATGLAMSLFDTPQSVSLIDAAFVKSFYLNDVNDVLSLATGVNVESVETDRTYYNARGFDIKSMQVDGIGLPFNWNIVGALDTIVYEKVEIIRGANGLLTGTGNPSGTINYVRKRPTNDVAGNVQITTGSYDHKRISADLNTPLTADGSWAGRLVAAAESEGSHLDSYEHDRRVAYGVLDGQVGKNATLTFGYTHQQSESVSVLWGALPLLYSDGGQTDFDRDTSTSMDWTYWDTRSDTVFAELTYALADGWEIKSTLTYSDYEEPSELFYTYGLPDRDTGLGLFGYPGKYLSTNERKLFDTTLTGSFNWLGRSHDLLFGLNISRGENGYLQSAAPGSDPAWGALPAFPGWQGDEIARPDFGPALEASDFTDDVQRFYAVSNFHVTDAFNVMLGINAIKLKTDGYNFGESADRNEEDVSPYIGAVYNVTDAINVYASYSDIFEPQSELAEDLSPLGSAKGKSYEGGVKAELLGGRLLASVAGFRAEQTNYAESAGMVGVISVYRGADFTSKGFELEAAGQVTDNWTLQAGYTQLDLDTKGAAVRTFIPTKTLKVGTRYSPSLLPDMELGLSYRWQEDVYTISSGNVIEQPSYGAADGYISYDITSTINLQANVKNISDKKYLTSLYWDQAYYAPPRTAQLSLTIKL